MQSCGKMDLRSHSDRIPRYQRTAACQGDVSQRAIPVYAGAAQGDEYLAKFYTIFSGSVISVDYAGNTCVVKCYAGMAQAACAAIDAMHFEGIVGTLAGMIRFLYFAARLN